VPYLVGFPGYFTAVALIDRLGRKLIQVQGFVIMAVIYLIVQCVGIVSGTKVEGFLIPATTAFLILRLIFLLH